MSLIGLKTVNEWDKTDEEGFYLTPEIDTFSTTNSTLGFLVEPNYQKLRNTKW